MFNTVAEERDVGMRHLAMICHYLPCNNSMSLLRDSLPVPPQPALLLSSSPLVHIKNLKSIESEMGSYDFFKEKAE